jgi:transcriptional regulator with XRE-family HTH domain
MQENMEQESKLEEWCKVWTAIVSSKVKMLREGRGFTQQDLAYKADISVSTLSNIESGGSFNTKTLFALAFALGVHPIALFVDEEV